MIRFSNVHCSADADRKRGKTTEAWPMCSPIPKSMTPMSRFFLVNKGIMLSMQVQCSPIPKTNSQPTTLMNWPIFGDSKKRDRCRPISYRMNLVNRFC